MPVNRLLSSLQARAVAREVRRGGTDNAAPNLPVIYLPGILGSKLFDRRTRKTIWGDYRGVFTPSDYEYDPAAAHVVAGEQLHAFSIIPGLLDTLVTAELKTMLETAAGYREHQDLFFLAHDWRGDLRGVADLLELEVTRLKRLFSPSQRFVIVAQSASNLAVRYWLRTTSSENRERIAKWYAFGPPWQGTFHAWSMMETGYYPAGERFYGFSPDDIAGYPGAQQLLPFTPSVMNGYGETITDFNLYDAQCWAHYHMGPYRIGVTQPSDQNRRVRAKLSESLENVRQFTQAVSGVCPAEQNVPQTWYLSDNNHAVKTAIYHRNHWYLLARDIRRNFPDLSSQVLVPGDDHLPLSGLLEHACGPCVRDTAHHPSGENFVVISRARTHRALINHKSNLRSLTLDLISLRALS